MIQTDMKLRLQTKGDVEPNFQDATCSYEEFAKQNGIEHLNVYGTIGYNSTIHLLSAFVYESNGEKIIMSAHPRCGTSTRNRVTCVDFKATLHDVNCEKCLKKMK